MTTEQAERAAEIAWDILSSALIGIICAICISFLLIVIRPHALWSELACFSGGCVIAHCLVLSALMLRQHLLRRERG